MFQRECEMVRSTAYWMKSVGMTVKSEFVTPWGICDLVGLVFNPDKVDQRLRLQQTKPVGSIVRAALLLQIPDVDTRKSITLDILLKRCATSLPRDVVEYETARLVDDNFVVAGPRGRLQKVNGWFPLQDRFVAVELKLSRIEEAMHQARNNLGFACESYVGLPSEVADRVARRPSRWNRYFEAGVGLLSVQRRTCKVLVPAQPNRTSTDPAVQLYCAEKFWRTRLKGS